MHTEANPNFRASGAEFGDFVARRVRLQQRVIDQPRDVGLDRTDLGAGGNSRGAGFHHFSRFARALLRATLIATRANQFVNFEPAKVGAFFAPR